MSKEQISRRHHYLPEFLLKGFAGNDGKLFVYDKHTGRFWKNTAVPKQVFYRYNQNTFTIGDEETDFVETLYTKFDNDFAPVYDRILQMPGPVELNIDDTVSVLLFVAVSFYRVPANDETVANYVKSKSPQSLGFRLYNHITNEDIGPEWYKILLQEPSFVESYRISKVLVEIMRLKRDIKLDNWTIAAPTTLKGFGLIGDNPVIMRNAFEENFIDQEMIMPLSKHHVVHHYKGNKPAKLHQSINSR
jgi:hypothetical protein